MTADLRGTVSNEARATGTHMHVDSLTLELTIKKVRMHIAKVFKNNRILSKCWRLSCWRHPLTLYCTDLAEATNLFLRENGLEVLKAMQPQLQKKLAVKFASIANQLLTHVPIENFLV